MAKVMICDDAAFMRMMIKDILTKNGYEIAAEAENGAIAVEKYPEAKPDLVLMDITMPDMDGIQALKKIKEIDANANVIMCSAMGQQAMVIEAIQSGAKDFIVKPFQAERVLEAVMILLSASFRSLMQLIGVLIIFVFVLIITYFTTKWVGGFQKIQMSKGNLMVLETIRIANGKFLQLVKAGEQYFVIAVGKDEVTKIAELTEDQLSVQTSDDMKNSQENFQEIFSRLKDHFPKKQD